MKTFDQLVRYRAGTHKPPFDVDVVPNGYRWWYADGISNDGHNGVVVIAFVGSVFSPYYYAARQRGATDPLDYCAINVGLYRRQGGRWCMTERSKRSIDRGRDFFRVGPSQLTWENDELRIDIDERSSPLAQPMRGQIRLKPHFINLEGFYLDPERRHRWRPVAPTSAVDVRMSSPSLSWRGHGYFDTNSGDRPLEEDFRRWSWSRREGERASDVTYSLELRHHAPRAASIRISAPGQIDDQPLPAAVNLKRGLWRMQRSAHCGVAPDAVRDLEDTPFYTRSILTDTQFGGDTMHEFLDLDRFRSRWVRLLLPFRMPRVR